MAKSQTVRKGIITFLFPNFSRIQPIEVSNCKKKVSNCKKGNHYISFSKFFENTTNRETENFASAIKKQASNFLPPCFRAVLYQTQRGKIVAAFFCH